MNKLYTLSLAGLLAVGSALEAAPASKAAELKSRLSSMLATTRSTGPGNALITYGLGGTAWYYASKYIADKTKYLSPGYSELIKYDIAVAGAADVLDGVIPGAGFVCDTATEVGYLYTVADLLRGELSKKLPAHYNNNDLVKLAYLLVGYKTLKLAVTYGPGIAYDAVSAVVTTIANVIASAEAGCPDCPPCNQTAEQVAAL